MMAHVFKITNEVAGRFAVQELSQIHSAFDLFCKAHPVEHGYYVECSGKRWTVVSKAASFVLDEGGQAVGPTRVDASDNTESFENTRVLKRFLLLLFCIAVVVGAIALAIHIFKDMVDGLQSWTRF